MLGNGGSNRSYRFIGVPEGHHDLSHHGKKPEKLESIATNDLGEASNSTPAVSDGQIFIRTFKGLYCIAE